MKSDAHWKTSEAKSDQSTMPGILANRHRIVWVNDLDQSYKMS